jgi:hypothetical protein
VIPSQPRRAFPTATPPSPPAPTSLAWPRLAVSNAHPLGHQGCLALADFAEHVDQLLGEGGGGYLGGRGWGW